MRDVKGNGCNYYNTHSDDCGAYDWLHFRAQDLCCTCKFAEYETIPKEIQISMLYFRFMSELSTAVIVPVDQKG